MPARIKMQNILTRSQLSNQKSGSARHARAIKTTMLGLLCLLGMSTTERSYAAEANANTVVREYKQELEQARFAELMAHYGQHKELPPGYELQALLALSHYPELRDVRIRFIVNDVDIPLSSRPYWASMLRSAKNRRYHVIIDSEREGPRQALLLSKQPFNAQVGILGHELAHTVYYLERSFLGIAGDAMCQFSACRIEFERATDRRLIDYGLGWQRYDHALFVRSQLNADPQAALNSEGGGGAYMSPADLMRLMRENPAYEASLLP